MAVVTTTTAVGAYRGAGRPEATAAVERAIDLFAAEIGMDPAGVRRRNLLLPFTDPHRTAFGALYDTVLACPRPRSWPPKVPSRARTCMRTVTTAGTSPAS